MTTAHAPLADAIAERLTAHNITVHPVASPTGQADCAIITEALVPASSAEQHFNALLAARQAKPSRILLVGGVGQTNSIQATGIAGLARTLRAEWADLDIGSVSLLGDEPSKAADAVWHALSATHERHLISTPKGLAHYVLGAELHAPAQRAVPPFTWLVTGGGRGVTAACAIELARRTGGTFLLAGRSPIVDWPDDIPLTETLPELIGRIARRRPGNTPTQLRQIARTLLSSQQVRNTLRALQAVDARAQYLPLDISNGDAIAATLPGLLSQYGPIKGLIHGAGVLADKHAENITLADFNTVFAPKVDGLHHLFAQLPPTELSHIALFSSASALFGNAGQAAYATANDMLNSFGYQLAQVHPHLHVRSFSWGPWQGGMVTAALAERFKARGIPLISEPEGARIFADQMLSIDRNPVHLCIGDAWPA